MPNHNLKSPDAVDNEAIVASQQPSITRAPPQSKLFNDAATDGGSVDRIQTTKTTKTTKAEEAGEIPAMFDAFTE